MLSSSSAVFFCEWLNHSCQPLFSCVRKNAYHVQRFLEKKQTRPAWPTRDSPLPIHCQRREIEPWSQRWRCLFLLLKKWEDDVAVEAMNESVLFASQPSLMSIDEPGKFGCFLVFEHICCKWQLLRTWPVQFRRI